MSKKVLVPLAEGFEEIEAITVIDLLRRAQIAVTTAGLRPGPVRASRGVVVVPDTTLDAALAEAYDMVVLPGGQPGTDNLAADPRIDALLKRMHAEDRWTAAICAAPKVLAGSGLLRGHTATSYPGVLESLQLTGTTLSAQPVVTDGKVITSRGPGTAMDFALHLIETLLDRPTRDRVEAALQRPA